MLTEHDKKWLLENYPDLSYSEDEGISGTVTFKATYNKDINRFLILGDNIENTVGGLELGGTFTINIKETTDKKLSELPSLYIEGVNPIANRHINETPDNHRACLCSPFVEDQYLTPTFNFKKYFEELVIPFLYGQLFYDQEKRWAWEDLSHGSIGLLESYLKINDSTKAKECLEKLPRDFKNWRSIRILLAQKAPIKGHTVCFCQDGSKIRDCHTNAWKGAEKLRQDIKTQSLVIPQ